MIKFLLTGYQFAVSMKRVQIMYPQHVTTVKVRLPSTTARCLTSRTPCQADPQQSYQTTGVMRRYFRSYGQWIDI